MVAGDILDDLFTDLLNIPNCDQIPDLAPYRQRLEDHFIKTCKANVLSDQFNCIREILEKK